MTEIVQVDAFTDRPFAGNPAAVCVLPDRDPRRADSVWMQQVALEMNLSETAFLHRTGGAYALRWFTPTIEVDLCGHATLAAAHVLWSDRHVAPETAAVFDTRSGRLTAERRGGWIELDFPSMPPAPATPPPGLLTALGVEASYVGRTCFDYLVDVDREDVVRRLTPDLRALRALDVRGVIVTGRATTAGFDIVSRFFAPGAGVDEDPVTGSAHCCLAPYWSARLQRDELIAYQASSRGGVIQTRVVDDRVRLGGQAVTVFRATLTIP